MASKDLAFVCLESLFRGRSPLSSDHFHPDETSAQGILATTSLSSYRGLTHVRAHTRAAVTTHSRRQEVSTHAPPASRRTKSAKRVDGEELAVSGPNRSSSASIFSPGKENEHHRPPHPRQKQIDATVDTRTPDRSDGGHERATKRALREPRDAAGRRDDGDDDDTDT